MCQASTTEPLRCPVTSIKLRGDEVKLTNCLTKVINNLHELHQANKLPKRLRVDDVLKPTIMPVDGSGEASGECDWVSTMKAHNVVWHTSCKNSINTQKVARCRPREEPSPVPVKTRRLDIVVILVDNAVTKEHQACFICERPCPDGRNVWSLEVDVNVRKAAETLGDGELLGKMLHQDLIALNAVYHHTCLSNLYRRAEEQNKENETQRDMSAKDVIAREITLKNTLDFLERQRNLQKTIPMSEITRFYNDRLLAAGCNQKAHSTRLRLSIESELSGVAFGQKQSGIWELIFKEELKTVDVSASLRNAAEVLRRDILALKNTFVGSFHEQAEEDSVPESLTKKCCSFSEWGHLGKSDNQRL